MKKVLTCTKGTTRRSIHKTVSYPPIPNLPLIGNLQEAFDYIYLQHKEIVYFQKEIDRWKRFYESFENTMDLMDSTLKFKNECIERLKMGDIPPNTFIEMRNTLESQQKTNDEQEKEIKKLKAELKKGKKFHYKDFILN